MKLDHQNRKIVMDRTFAKKSEVVGSREYLLLQDCRRPLKQWVCGFFVCSKGKLRGNSGLMNISFETIKEEPADRSDSSEKVCYIGVQHLLETH